MPSVLCTGGTGFVGSHVVQNLLERRQYKVHILARRGSRVPAIAFGAHLIEGDVERPEDINAALRAAQPEYVFHLAGVYAWWQRDPDRFERVNVDAVRSLVAACSCHAHEIGRRVKLVHVSTPLAYGVPASGQGHAPQTAIDEETLPGAPSSRYLRFPRDCWLRCSAERKPRPPPRARYARSKRAGDLIAQAAFEGGELDGCTCLLACCIGQDCPARTAPPLQTARTPTQPPWPCAGADPKLLDPERDVMRIKELTQGRVPATITSDTVFTYVAVRDAAEAIVRTASPPEHSLHCGQSPGWLQRTCDLRGHPNSNAGARGREAWK